MDSILLQVRLIALDAFEVPPIFFVFGVHLQTSLHRSLAL